ncbi:MAG: hypothetical protein JKX84_08675 [Flavobacteriales bacterium]|nr:hypothetical protein [Flavobacteriales bacterium]
MKHLYILIVFLIISSSLFIGEAIAQTPPPGAPPAAGAPLDGMTAVLLAAGIGYGARKFRKKHEK